MAEPVHPILNLYVDDSGTRHPDKAPPTSPAGDWFGFGGILLQEADEAQARASYEAFCKKWDITYPLHSSEIRHKSGGFTWLGTKPGEVVAEFFTDLDQLIIDLPVAGHACVIDRPGYHARYHEKHGANRWHLCKTAFSVLAERAAKYAASQDARVVLFVEEADRSSDQRIRSYFAEMRDTGMPFDQSTSGKYGPMSPEELRFRLLDLRFKRKSSPMMQMADLFLYPMCRGAYETGYRPSQLLREHRKLIDHRLSEEHLPTLGIKYSCFDQNKKGPEGPLLPASYGDLLGKACA